MLQKPIYLNKDFFEITEKNEIDYNRSGIRKFYEIHRQPDLCNTEYIQVAYYALPQNLVSVYVNDYKYGILSVSTKVTPESRLERSSSFSFKHFKGDEDFNIAMVSGVPVHEILLYKTEKDYLDAVEKIKGMNVKE